MDKNLQAFIKSPGWEALQNEIIKRLEDKLMALKLGLNQEEAFGDYKQKCGLMMIESFLNEIEQEALTE